MTLAGEVPFVGLIVETGLGVAPEKVEGPATAFTETGGRDASQDAAGFHAASGVEGFTMSGTSVFGALCGTPCNPRTNLTRDWIRSSASGAASIFT